MAEHTLVSLGGFVHARRVRGDLFKGRVRKVDHQGTKILVDRRRAGDSLQMVGGDFGSRIEVEGTGADEDNAGYVSEPPREES